MEPADFLAGRTRETKIRRDADGRWWNDGVPISHPNLARAFDRWLKRADDGRYCLSNDINWAYVQVEGAPLFVRTLRVAGDDVILTLSNDAESTLDAATLREGPDGALYCDVGALPARFDRAAQHALEPVLREDEAGTYLAIGGGKVRPPRVAHPLGGSR